MADLKEAYEDVVKNNENLPPDAQTNLRNFQCNAMQVLQET